MDDRFVDVLIVGAGAAGCMVAANAPDGLQVLLVDAKEPSTGRCCAGMLNKDGLRAVMELGIELPPEVLVKPECPNIRVHDLDSGKERVFSTGYCNFDRAGFDSHLISLAKKRAEFHPHTRFVGATIEDNRIRTILKSGGRTLNIECKYLIGADGAGSTVRKTMYPARPGPLQMLALQAYFEHAEGVEKPKNHEVIFSAELTDFFAWIVPKPEHVIVGTAFESAHKCRQRFEVILNLAESKFPFLGNRISIDARKLCRPKKMREIYAGDGRVFLAGEAAGLVSPSSGEGISFALLSGAALGKSLNSDNPLLKYRKAFRREARRIRWKILKSPVYFTPWIRSIAMGLPIEPK